MDLFVLDGKRLICVIFLGNLGLVDVCVIDTEVETFVVLEYVYCYKCDVLILSVELTLGYVFGGELVIIIGKGLS